MNTEPPSHDRDPDDELLRRAKDQTDPPEDASPGASTPGAPSFPEGKGGGTIGSSPGGVPHPSRSAKNGAPFPPAPPAEATRTETIAMEEPVGAIPKRIGQYHIKRAIASGGMGTVYEAVQEKPRRTVAVKLMRAGIASRSALRRFEYESQLLARLRHPGIAQVYDAGTHRDGEVVVPYFAMEYIVGAKPVADYAKEKKLGTRERLELFAHVCDAVHHGHQKGIIHRDLKPSNILVDSTGQVKIIDFGVARSTDSDMAVTTLQTDVGQLIGTLQYMSPEQCAADPHDIDTRSDVYALGVVLYELLTDHLPYNISGTAIHEATRIIREQEPAKLSTISKALRGDVETIALKALEKDRDRRYRSAAELADDLRRYLHHEAIAARPPSIVYQLRVFARRHRGLMFATAAVFAVLLAGVIVSTSLYLRAENARSEAVAARDEAAEQRNLAQQHAARAKEEARVALVEKSKSEQVAIFMKDMLKAAGPQVALGRDVTMLREILDQTAERVGTDLEGQPEVEADIRDTIGMTYLDMGLYDRAESMLRPAVAIRQSLFGEEHEAVSSSLNNLAVLLKEQGKLSEAEPLLREALAMKRKLLGDEHPQVAISLNSLAALLVDQGKLSEAEPLHREALAMYRKLPGDEHPNVASSLNNLAELLRDQGKLSEAEPLHREALAMYRKLLGDEHPNVASSLNNLAELLRDQGKPSEAEPLSREALAMNRKLLGDEHPKVAFGKANLGTLLRSKGDLDEAESLLRQATDILRVSVGEDHWITGNTRSHLGDCLTKMKRHDEAEAELLKAHDLLQAGLGDDHQRTVLAVQRLATLYEAWNAADPGKGYAEKAAEYRAKLPPPELGEFLAKKGSGLLEKGDHSEAEGVLRECLETRRQALAEGDWLIFNTMSLLGESLSGQGKFAEAEPLLLEANMGLTEAAETIPVIHRETRLRESIQRIVSLYESWNTADPSKGYDAKAAEYRAMLPASPKSEDLGHPAEESDDALAAQP